MTKILAVDDQYVMRQLYKNVLEKNFEVDLAKDGKEAYDMATARSYDLIITDLNMPVMDGLELVKRLRRLSKFNGIPILVVSTESQQSKKTTAKELGASGWVVKPISADKLVAIATKLTS